MSDTQTNTPVFAGLEPGIILDAVDRYELKTEGGLLALNSYENRVYKVECETGPAVVKFYRPARWSDETILEEHEFSLELAGHDIPVVAPLAGPGGSTLQHFEGFRYAVFPCQGGRAAELNEDEDWRQMGRFVGRLHAVGAQKPFVHRSTISMQEFGYEPVEYVLANGFIPPELVTPYQTLAEDLLARIQAVFDEAGAMKSIRLHGDCHLGNVLWTDDGPHFVDLDDCRNGPAIQDLWMMLSGDRQDRTIQLDALLEGYSQFYSFDSRELVLIEALRGLRMVHYAGWLARRWQDPAFPLAFPWFNTPRYWEEHILSLREQYANLDEPTLVWYG